MPQKDQKEKSPKFCLSVTTLGSEIPQQETTLPTHVLFTIRVYGTVWVAHRVEFLSPALLRYN